MSSPQFTNDKPGCTWIKETTYSPGDNPNKPLAEGYFGTVNERTLRHQPITAETGGTITNTPTNIISWLTLGFVLLGGTIRGVYAYQRRKYITPSPSGPAAKSVTVPLRVQRSALPSSALPPNDY